MLIATLGERAISRSKTSDSVAGLHQPPSVSAARTRRLVVGAVAWMYLHSSRGALVRKDLLSLGTTESPNPWAGVLLSDQEALQIIAVLADVHDGHDVRDAVGAAWSLLSNRLGAQAGVADPRPEYLASLWDRLANRPRPWADPEHRPPPNSGSS
jgi:hypothetical protein